MFAILELWLKNKKLFEEIESNHKKNNFKYPKLLHLYWDGSPLSFLNYLTVVSFNEYHKNWKINIYTPVQRTKINSWKSSEQSLRYEGNCYFHKLSEISNVVIHKVCLDEIGFYSNASEVIKSDYLRYHILQKHGGLWSDFDIVYTASVEEKMNFDEDMVMFRCLEYIPSRSKEASRTFECALCSRVTQFDRPSRKITPYYPVGLFLCQPQNGFLSFILDRCLQYYDATEYQSIGANMFDELSPFTDPSIKICNEDYYLPWAWNELDEFLEKKDNESAYFKNIGFFAKMYTLGLIR